LHSPQVVAVVHRRVPHQRLEPVSGDAVQRLVERVLHPVVADHLRDRSEPAFVHERGRRVRQERFAPTAAAAAAAATVVIVVVAVQRRAVDYRAPPEQQPAVLDQRPGVHVPQAPGQRAPETGKLLRQLVQHRLRHFPAGAGRGPAAQQRVAAHADRPLELVPRPGRQHVQARAHRARALSEHRHVPRRAAEAVDVPLHPVERGRLVQQSPVARRGRRVVRVEAQYVQPVRHRHYDHL